METDDAKDQKIYDLPSKRGNNQQIDYFFILKTENSESVIINSSTEKEFEKVDEHDYILERQESIKIEVTEQANNGNLEGANLEVMQKQIVKKEVTKALGHIQPKADCFLQKTEYVESLIINSHTGEEIKETFEEYDDNEQGNIKIEVFEQMNDNNEASQEVVVDLEEEKEQQAIKEEDSMSSEKDSIQAIDDFLMQKAEYIVSEITNSNTEEVLKEKFNEHDDYIEQKSIQIEIIEKINDNNGTSDEVNVKEEIEKQIVVEEDFVRIHFENKEFKCKVCNRLFLQIGALRQHFREHTDELQGKEQTSSFCEKRYVNSNELSAHIRVHTGEKQFVCHKCRKEFSELRKLNRHLKIHSYERNHTCNRKRKYNCGRCSKSFKRRDHLNLHFRTHTGVKPYVCNICDTKFSASSSLKSHLQIHYESMPVKMYACDRCSKKFSKRYSLIRHIRIHTEEKSYACNINM